MPATTLADAILQNQSDAIVATDRAGLITFWNPAAARIFGFASNEAVGRSLDIIIPVAGTAAIMRDVSKSFEEKLQLRKRVAELSRGAS